VTGGAPGGCSSQVPANSGRVTTSVAAAAVSIQAMRCPSPSDGASWAPDEQEALPMVRCPATTSPVAATRTLPGPVQEPSAPQRSYVE
jgi:hypothetical protein